MAFGEGSHADREWMREVGKDKDKKDESTPEKKSMEENPVIKQIKERLEKKSSPSPEKKH